MAATIYLLCYRLSNDAVEAYVPEIAEKLQAEFPNHWHYNDGLWIFQSEQSPGTIFKRLQTFIVPHEQLLFMSLSDTHAWSTTDINAPQWFIDAIGGYSTS